ncbi:hypothetical protein D3C72_2086720 [compost metagenome]
MEGARPRRRQASGHLSGELGMGGRHEGGVLLVPHQDEADPIPVLVKAVHQAVGVVPRDAEDRVDAPVVQGFDDGISHRGR